MSNPTPAIAPRTEANARTWLVHACGAALAVVAGLVLYIAVVGPVQDRRRQASTDRERLDQANIALADAEAQIVSTTRALEDIRERLSHAVTLKDQRHINRRISELTSLASASGVVLTDVQPGQARAAGRYDVVPIKLAGKGAYPTAADFLSRLHAQLRDMDVHEMELRASPQDSVHTATISLELAWHTLPAGPARQASDRAPQGQRSDRADRADRGNGADPGERADRDDRGEGAPRDGTSPSVPDPRR